MLAYLMVVAQNIAGTAWTVIVLSAIVHGAATICQCVLCTDTISDVGYRSSEKLSESLELWSGRWSRMRAASLRVFAIALALAVFVPSPRSLLEMHLLQEAGKIATAANVEKVADAALKRIDKLIEKID